MNLLKITTNGQITLPAEIRKKWHCDVGNYVQVIFENNELKIKPIVVTDPSQLWFWSKEWQEGEKKADEDIRSGQISKKFSNAQEVIKSLKQTKLKSR